MEKSSFYYTKSGKILRWVFFIPIGVLAGFLVSLLALGFTYLRAKFIGGDGQWDLMIPPYFFYLAFTYTAWLIIPKYKNKVIGLLIICKLLYSAFVLLNYTAFETSLSRGMFIVQEVFTALSCFILSIYLTAKYDENEDEIEDYQFETEIDEIETGDNVESNDMFKGIDEIMGQYDRNKEK